MFTLIELIGFVLFLFIIAATGQSGGNDSVMWNILNKKTLHLHPADAACVSPKTYCLPSDAPAAPARSDNPVQQCLVATCTPKDISISAINDENLGSVFVTRSLDRLELVANFSGINYDVFHLRLVFSGNPPAAIAIERFTEGATAWVSWQYYAVDCMRSFGIQPDQKLAAVNTIQCSTLPWAPNGSHRQDSVYWNVFQGRPGAPEISRNPELQQFFSTVAVRVTLEGHLLPLQPGTVATGTDYGWDVYRIAEVSIYGRCGDKFYRSLSDPTSCLPCECSLPGSVNETCLATGACFCKINYTGTKCSACRAGFFDAARGCLPCNCAALGSTAEVCDNQTGMCLCVAGFAGQRCDECERGKFLTGQRCVECGCVSAGTTPEQCSRNGTCLCKRFVIGTTCDKCLNGFVNLTSANPNGCVLGEPLLGFPATRFPVLAMTDLDFDHTVASRAAPLYPITLALNGDSVTNNSTIASGTTLSLSQTSSHGDALYPWLIAITVLLIIALIILIIHFIFYIRRRNAHKTYSPRQIPEFLSAEANAHLHPDYARRHIPPKNAKLTGYFYNPEYPIGSLTPGVDESRHRAVDVFNRQQNLEEEDEDLNYVGPNLRRPDLDLSREPATTGTFRPHTYHRSPIQRQDIATISGGIVNQNFNPSDLHH
ncbi:usherin-like [Paramacrobiotus metropolitanus]|uniref:usherin-like n=1 Tax=Paramacrobiotus metropolitanus TaxID=2943436 RepID=UPI00244607B6|nr:usherin-like [Paramacrobiotus metropolitanus]